MLDNFEHVLEAASTVSTLLETSNLCVLATSRILLNVPGERVFRVTPLAVAPAVRLFYERARDPLPAWTASPGTAAQVCRDLDCLPLAIELAAARTHMLSPPALLSHLHGAMSLLTGGPRNLSEHQRTLRETIAWSHALLPAPERALFRHLAVFDGGWDLDAARVVGELSGPAVVSLHASLLDSSLVVRERGAQEPRFRFLNTICAFAMEAMRATDDLDTIQDRHAIHYRDLALAGPIGLPGAAALPWMTRLHADKDNVRAALRRALSRRWLADFARMCFMLSASWTIEGRLMEGQAWTDAGLAESGDLDRLGGAMLRYAAAMILQARGQYRVAWHRLQEAAALVRDTGEEEVLSWVLTLAGWVATLRGRYDAAAAVLADVEERGGRLGHVHAAAHAATARALVAVTSGRLDVADRLLDRCEAVMRGAGAGWTLGIALGYHGRIRHELGDHAAGDRLLREAVSILARWRDLRSLPLFLRYVADSAVLRSAPERAIPLYSAADVLLERGEAVALPDWERRSEVCRARAAAAVGPDALDRLRLAGESMDIDDAVRLALGSCAPAGRTP